VQDLGRPGRAHLGVPGSGAADRGSLRLANRAVGNPQEHAALEVLVGPAAFEAQDELVVAVTGAFCDVFVNDRAQGRGGALALGPGDVLRVAAGTRGLRTYVAVRGGFDLPAVLGSRSYDQLSDLGPPPLRRGDLLPVGDRYAEAPSWEALPFDDPPTEPVLRVTPGPRADWLTAPHQLGAKTWTVLPSSDRTGVRLGGSRVDLREGDLASEGVVPGSVQLPPDGLPIVLGPDAGVTGGYPVVAVVVDTDRDLIGQLAPGVRVRFQTVR